MGTNRSTVEAVFREVLQLGDRDPRGAVPGEEWSWDSLAHVILVGALESEFGVQIDTAASLEITSFESAVSALTARGIDFGEKA